METNNDGPIKVSKFMLEVSVYPSGFVATKMFPIGQSKKEYSQMGKKRKQNLKDFPEMDIIGKEEY